MFNIQRLIVSIVLILFGCKSLPEETSDAMLVTDGDTAIDSVTLEVTSQVQFPLDSVSSASTYSVQVYPRNTAKYLLYFHPSINQIAVYSIKPHKLMGTIKIQSEGPDGVGSGIRAMHFQSFDSIFLFSPHAQRLMLIDSAGHLKGAFSVMNDSAYAMLGTMTPAVMMGNSMLLCAYPSGMRRTSSKDFAIIRFNLTSGQIAKVFSYSKEYEKGPWGKHNYLEAYQTYNDISNILVISFPNDNYVYALNGKNEAFKYYGGAEAIGELKPLSELVVENDEEVFRHEGMQGHYSGIFFCLSPLIDWTKIVNQFRYSKFRNQCQNQDDNLALRRSTVSFRKQSGKATARPAASTI